MKEITYVKYVCVSCWAQGTKRLAVAWCVSAVHSTGTT